MPFPSRSNASDGKNINSCKHVQLGDNNMICSGHTNINAQTVYINGSHNHFNINAAKVVVGGHDNVVNTQNSTDVQLQNEEESCCSDNDVSGTSSETTQSVGSLGRVDCSATPVEVFSMENGARVLDGDVVIIGRRDDVTGSSACFGIYVGDGDVITVCPREHTAKTIQVTDQAEFFVVATGGHRSSTYSRSEVIERSKQRLNRQYEGYMHFTRDVLD